MKHINTHMKCNITAIGRECTTQNNISMETHENCSNDWLDALK